MLGVSPRAEGDTTAAGGAAAAAAVAWAPCKHAARRGFVFHTLRWCPPSSHAIMSLNTWDSLWQYQFRIILLGDSTVGKSSLLKRFTDGIYSDVADPTVGVDFYARALDIEPGVKIKLQLWDTAGQERFR